MIPSCAPLGRSMLRKVMIRLSARSTPGIERTRSTRDSGKAWLKSTFGVFLEVTQSSASMCSMVTEALSRSPRNKPTWNRTRRTAKATPATVMANRVRSCRSVLRARSTMAASAGQDAVQQGLEQVARAGLDGSPGHPLVAGHRDLQGAEPVDAGPQRLGDQLRVPGLLVEASLLDALLHHRAEEGVGVALGHALAIRRRLPGGLGRHEHQAVAAGMRKGELHVGAAQLAHPLDGVGLAGDAHRLLGESGEVALADLAEERVLVGEVLVDGGGGILDAFGDLAHRDRLDPLAREHLARGREDLLAQLQPLPVPALRRPHAAAPERRWTI